MNKGNKRKVYAGAFIVILVLLILVGCVENSNGNTSKVTGLNRYEKYIKDHPCCNPNGHEFRQKQVAGGYSEHHGGYYCIYCLMEIDV